VAQRFTAAITGLFSAPALAAEVTVRRRKHFFRSLLKDKALVPAENREPISKEPKMSTYPVTIRRCQHIKVNGIQCGSPALRNQKRCYFHEQCLVRSREIDLKFLEPGVIQIDSLEDANSIQIGLAEVMRMLLMKQIDHRTASLLLRALRTAAANVKFTSFEPEPTDIVIDPKSAENRPLGAPAWPTTEGRDCDDIDGIDIDGKDIGKTAAAQKNLSEPNHNPSPRDPNFVSQLESEPTPSVEIPSQAEQVERTYQNLNNWKLRPMNQTTEPPAPKTCP